MFDIIKIKRDYNCRDVDRDDYQAYQAWLREGELIDEIVRLRMELDRLTWNDSDAHR